MWDIWEALEKWIPDTSSVADVGEKGRAKGARTCGIVADNVTGAVLTRENAKPGRRRRHIPIFCDDGRRLRGLAKEAVVRERWVEGVRGGRASSA